MEVELHPGQSEVIKDLFIDQSVRYPVVNASRGFGKSYLAAVAEEHGAPATFIRRANEVNLEMPKYIVSRVKSDNGSSLKGKSVQVIGVAYKPNVADVRESPVEALISGLKQKGAQVSWHDDLVKEWNSEKSVTLSSDFDLAIIATPHDYLDLKKLGNVPILNTRGSI